MSDSTLKILNVFQFPNEKDDINAQVREGDRTIINENMLDRHTGIG